MMRDRGPSSLFALALAGFLLTGPAFCAIARADTAAQPAPSGTDTAPTSTTAPTAPANPNLATCQDANEQRQADAAIAACSKALESATLSAEDRAKALTARGVGYSAKGDSDRAYADFDAVVKLTPKDAKAYGNRGNAAAARGDNDSAIAD